MLYSAKGTGGTGWLFNSLPGNIAFSATVACDGCD